MADDNVLNVDVDAAKILTDDDIQIGDDSDVFNDIFEDEPPANDGTVDDSQPEPPANDGTVDDSQPEPAAAPAKPKGKPGRPRVYTPEQRASMAVLIRQHGITGTQRILAASTNAKPKDFSGIDDLDRYANHQRAIRQAQERDQTLWPAGQSFKISAPTLKSVADEAGITLRPGRPKIR